MDIAKEYGITPGLSPAFEAWERSNGDGKRPGAVGRCEGWNAAIERYKVAEMIALLEEVSDAQVDNPKMTRLKIRALLASLRSGE